MQEMLRGFVRKEVMHVYEAESMSEGGAESVAEAVLEMCTTNTEVGSACLFVTHKHAVTRAPPHLVTSQLVQLLDSPAALKTKIRVVCVVLQAQEKLAAKTREHDHAS